MYNIQNVIRHPSSMDNSPPNIKGTHNIRSELSALSYPLWVIRYELHSLKFVKFVKACMLADRV